MARYLLEIQPTEERGLLPLPLTALGIRVAGCSCNDIGLLVFGSYCLLRFANCHLVMLEVHTLLSLPGCTVMATGHKADPLARE
jgi:hypothetical protein